jgi:steroid delta-isomerase-like uncharacterized protein
MTAPEREMAATDTGPEPANKELVRRMHSELVGRRDSSRLDDFLASDFVSHSAPPGYAPDRDGARRFLEMLAAALPDLSVTIDLIVAEGDLVAVRTTMRGTHEGELAGLPASGRRVAVDAVDILRIDDGRVVEHWGLTNMLGLLEQAGPLASARLMLRRLARGLRRG